MTSTEDVLAASPPGWSSAPPRGAPTPAKSVTITNTGGSDLVVSNVTIGGTNPNQFALASGQPTSFTVPAGQTATVSAQFTATTAFGDEGRDDDDRVSNDPLVPNYQVSLRGFNAGGTVGDTEPGFQDLMTTLGYSTSRASTAPTRRPPGPRSVTRSSPRTSSGSTPRSRSGSTRSPATSPPRPSPRTRATHRPSTRPAAPTLYKFPADTVDEDPDDGVDTTVFAENQKLMPHDRGGRRPTPGTRRAVFGITGNYANYTDDQFNKGATGTIFRNLRVYPAKGPGGVVIPNTWLIGVDINITDDKNFDYQDQVMLLTNATPELVAAAAPGSADARPGLRRPGRRHRRRRAGRGHRLHTACSPTPPARSTSRTAST